MKLRKRVKVKIRSMFIRDYILMTTAHKFIDLNGNKLGNFIERYYLSDY